MAWCGYTISVFYLQLAARIWGIVVRHYLSSTMTFGARGSAKRDDQLHTSKLAFTPQLHYLLLSYFCTVPPFLSSSITSQRGDVTLCLPESNYPNILRFTFDLGRARALPGLKLVL